MHGPEAIPIAGGIAVVLSTRCPDAEQRNEDSAAIIPISARRGVLVVADGLGGGPRGATASRVAIEQLIAALQDLAPEDRLRSAVINGIEAANTAVLALGGGAGTTLVVVEIDGDAVRPYHVGDSKVLVLGQRARLKLETYCHAPVARAHQAGLLGETAAMTHEDRCLVSNVVGETEMRIEIGPGLSLCPRDTVLLGSDGLFDNLRLREIAEKLRKGRLLDSVGRTAALAHERMSDETEGQPSKPDDLTLIAFRRSA